MKKISGFGNAGGDRRVGCLPGQAIAHLCGIGQAPAPQPRKTQGLLTAAMRPPAQMPKQRPPAVPSSSRIAPFVTAAMPVAEKRVPTSPGPSWYCSDVGGDKIGDVVLHGRPDKGMPAFSILP